MEYISECNIDDVKEVLNRLPGCVWVKRGLLGQGVKGRVYDICCQRGDSLECKYAMKIVKRGKGDTRTFISTMEKEIRMQEDFAALNTGPNIVKALLCDHEAIIIMEKVDTDMNKYVSNVLVSLDTNEAINEINRIEEDFLYMLEKTYNNGLIHDDLHPENLGLFLKDERYYKPVFIDFGASYYLHEKKTSPLSELKHDMKLTFNNFRKAISSNLLSPPARSHRSPPRVEKRKGARRLSPSPVKRGGGLFDSPSSTPVKRGGLFDSPSSTPVKRGGLFDSPSSTPVKGKKLFSFDD
jgi:tRNA A-37 threonylcarbamoyl transferase component Bud32